MKGAARKRVSCHPRPVDGVLRHTTARRAHARPSACVKTLKAIWKKVTCSVKGSKYRADDE